MKPRNSPPQPISEVDAAVLEQLWNAHSRAVHTAALAFTRNEADAADVLALTFQRLASRVNAAASAENPRAFLIATARNVAVDLARQSLSREKREEVTAEVDCAETQSPPVFSDQDLRTAILQALASLPGEQRRAVEGRLVRGLTLDAIAQNEKVSLQTIASRFRYGIDKIREQLRPYYDCITKHSMKPISNSSNTTETARIIHALEPRRVPSVAPGLEGFAAFAPDDANLDDAPEIDEIPVDELPSDELGDYVDLGDIENPEDIITDVFDPEVCEDMPVAFDDLFVIQTLDGGPVEDGEDIENLTDGEIVDDGTEGYEEGPVDPRILYMTGGPVPEGQPEGFDPSWAFRGDTGDGTSADGPALNAGLNGTTEPSTFTDSTDLVSSDPLVAEFSESDFPEVISLADDPLQNDALDFSHDLAGNVMEFTAPEIETSELSESFSMDLPVTEVVATAGADEVSEIADTSSVDTFVPHIDVATEAAVSDSPVSEIIASPTPEEAPTLLAAVQGPSTQTALAAAFVAGTVLQTRPARKQSKN